MKLKDFFVQIGGMSEEDANTLDNIVDFINEEKIDIGKIFIIDFEALKAELLTALSKYFFNVLNKKCDVNMADVTEIVEDEYDEIIKLTKYEAARYIGEKVGCSLSDIEDEERNLNNSPEDYIPPDFMSFVEEIHRRFIKK